MATKFDINRVKYYKSRLPLTVITKGLKRGSQLLIGRLIYRGLPISMKRTIALVICVHFAVVVANLTDWMLNTFPSFSVGRE